MSFGAYKKLLLVLSIGALSSVFLSVPAHALTTSEQAFIQKLQMGQTADAQFMVDAGVVKPGSLSSRQPLLYHLFTEESDRRLLNRSFYRTVTPSQLSLILDWDHRLHFSISCSHLFHLCSSKNWTPMHFVCHGRDSNEFRYDLLPVLLDHDADPNVLDGQGVPILGACLFNFGRKVQKERFQAIKYLLKYGADVNGGIKNSDGRSKIFSMFSSAAFDDVRDYIYDINVNIILALFDNGLKIGNNVIIDSFPQRLYGANSEWAVERYSNIFRILINHGADINATIGGRNLTQLAVENGGVLLAKKLIELGGDMNATAGPKSGTPDNANITKLTPIEPSQGAGTTQLKLKPIGDAPGTYQGVLWAGDREIQVVTHLVLAGPGELGGTYEFVFDGKPYKGSLGHREWNDKRATLTWEDDFGSGVLEIKFADDYSGFSGTWGEGNVPQAGYYWTGNR